MDPQLVQRTRYVLRSRVRRTQTCPIALFPSACKQLVDWLSNHPIFSSLICQLETRAVADVERIRALSSSDQMQGGVTPLGQYTATTIDEHAAICWAITHLVSRIGPNLGTIRGIYNAINNYLTDDDSFVDLDKTVETIRDVAIDGLFEYLDEKLDSRNITYGLLLKYKQRSEWFHRSRLRMIANGELEGKSGERALAVDLQEYVFDQQVEFVIEPVSASGETDLVLKDPEGGRLILDDKYIAEDAIRSAIVRKLSDGFHQVYRYCVDFNEPGGFLVVFIRTTKRLSLELEESDGARFLRLGGKIIYYVEVHISEEPSASRSGQAEEIQISRDELIETVED
jgi:hypothetical protein